MKYVGVDVAKQSHYACVTSENNKILTPPFSFANNIDGYNLLLSKFRKFPKNDVVVGLESTGVYGENLIAFLSEQGYKIALINPIETSGMSRKRIRNAKTDKIDSKGICKYLFQEEYRLLESQELSVLELRGICRFRQSLKKQNARLKTQLVSYLDVVFPEYHTLFSTVHGKGSYAVLTEFPSPTVIAKTNVAKLENVLKSASHGHFGRAKAEELKALAKKSIGNINNDKSFQIAYTIAQIRLIESQIDDTKKHLAELWDNIDTVLKTIPGIGVIDGAMIFSEIGDISRFRRPDQLIAFAGLDPATKQSGNFRAASTKMSKRGSAFLRYALVNAAWNVSMNNATFGEYYNLKLSEKKRHYKALGHVAGKLTRVIFAMLKNNMAFDLP
ncbi:MAG: IS110 family transposase [Chitinispirillales bacterium]|jgi:transposase|nr:IS110 family transposase [Chitinispirillales bacterium]